MNLTILKCPACGANIEPKTEMDFCFCEYCGTKIAINDETLKNTINKNINISKKLDKTIHYIDEAEIEQIKADDKKDKRSYIFIALFWGALATIILCINLYFVISPKVAERQGKISAGNYQDLIGEDYKTVEAHFKAAGFTNIELIDLDDSGMIFWSEGKVESISVGGDMDFDSYDRFDPNTKVVISYH